MSNGGTYWESVEIQPDSIRHGLQIGQRKRRRKFGVGGWLALEVTGEKKKVEKTCLT